MAAIAAVTAHAIVLPALRDLPARKVLPDLKDRLAPRVQSAKPVLPALKASPVKQVLLALRVLRGQWVLRVPRV